MQIRIDAPHIDNSDALRTRIEAGMGEALDKYFGRAVDVHVHFRKVNRGFSAAIAAHVGKGIELRADAEAGDAYSAFEIALNKLEKRLRRHKRRIRDSHHKQSSEPRALAAQEAVFAFPAETTDEDLLAQEGDSAEDGAPTIVAEMAVELSALSVAEAVMRLDLSDRPVLLFKNASNARISLVYRRSDGNIGWIEPSES